VSTVASAQDRECETDEDCGLGFDCYHSGPGTGVVTATGSGGSSSGSCGDGICRSDEDSESCPDDCDVYTRCVLADCDPFSSDPQCADGYECVEDGLGQGTTTSGPWCGDGACTGSETEANCPEDCTVTYSCQIEYRECDSDEECADGFYCYIPTPTTTNGSATTGVGGATSAFSTAFSTTSNWQVASVTGSSSTTSATGIGGAGSQSAPAAAGYCRVESSTAATSQGTTNASSTSATFTAASATSGAVGSATGAGGSASNGSATGNSAATDSATGSGGSGSGDVGGAAGADGSGGAADTQTASASDTLGSTANSSGGSAAQSSNSVSGSGTGSGGLGDPDDMTTDDVKSDAGCSCKVHERPPTGVLALMIGLFAAGWLRRLSGSLRS